MDHGTPLVSAQLRIADAELPLHGEAEVCARIDAARKHARLRRLLYCPTGSRDLDSAILHHARKQGVEVYLWYSILFDNAILPEAGEQVVDAFGALGPGETGEWGRIYGNDELRFLACPANKSYNRLVLGRCRQMLEEYDGLFVDALGFALPSFGLEQQFSCFCPACREREPRLADWRRRIRDLREQLLSADDGVLESWGTFSGMMEAFGLKEFAAHRAGLITALAERYAGLARDLGKGFGLDVVSPSLAWFAGHDLRALSPLANWIKPRIYCHTHGPSSLPLECRSLATGVKRWAERAGIPAVMQFIGRSIGIEMPESMYSLDQGYFAPDAACGEIRKSIDAAGSERVFPGIECSLHPDFETGVSEETVEHSLEAAKELRGVVLGWNLLFIPNNFLRMVGKAFR